MTKRELAYRQQGFGDFRRGQSMTLPEAPATWSTSRRRAYNDGWREAFYLSHTPNGTPETSPDAGELAVQS
jgi:hypothetical protein